MLHEFQRVIAASVTLTGVDLDEFISDDMNDRVVSRDGKDSWEFNVRIYKYPERAKLLAKRGDQSHAWGIL